MPELPEVETVKQGLEKIVNLKINEIKRSNFKLRIENQICFSRLINQEITKISRKARYLLIDFTNNYTMIIHLGMSGRLTLKTHYQEIKHDHFICKLSNDKWLIYNDPRRFGFVDLIPSNRVLDHKMLKNLGPEPLSPEFNQPYLSAKLKKICANIKTTMMDNKIVVGVGNIYINESLFDAKISPLRPANSLKKNEIEKLIKSIQKIIANAIELGGSSIADYQNADGEFGSFQLLHRVYDRHQENCVSCNAKIIKIVQNQRSSFYCHNCQN